MASSHQWLQLPLHGDRFLTYLCHLLSLPASDILYPSWLLSPSHHEAKCMINPSAARQRLWCFSQCSGCVELWGLVCGARVCRVLWEDTGPHPYVHQGTSLTALLTCHGTLWLKSLKITGWSGKTGSSFSPASSLSLPRSFLCSCSRSPERQLEILSEVYLLVPLAVCWGGDVHGAACWDPLLPEAAAARAFGESEEGLCSLLGYVAIAGINS